MLGGLTRRTPLGAKRNEDRLYHHKIESHAVLKLDLYGS